MMTVRDPSPFDDDIPPMQFPPEAILTERPKPQQRGNGKEHIHAVNKNSAQEKLDRRYTLLTADELAAKPPAPYRVKGVLIQEALAVIYGPSGSGKTFLGQDLAFAISDGLEWFGKKITPCEVLYIALEGEAGQAQRVRAYRERNGTAAGARLKFITSPFSLRFKDDVDALIATILEAGHRGGVTILDTFNAATPGMDENASADMSLVIEALKRIRQECGGLVILIHHSGKDATKGLRGHSSMAAALDTIIEVSRENGSDRRSWKLEKAKDGQDGEEHGFRLEMLEVGTDIDGDPVTSCVVVAEDRQQPGSRKAAKLSGTGKLALQTLREVMGESGESMPGTSTIPAGVKAVKIDQWRARFNLRYGSEGETTRGAEAVRKAFQRARLDLVEAQAVGISDPWCWQWTAT